MFIAGNELDLILITEILPKTLYLLRDFHYLVFKFLNFHPDSSQSIQHLQGVGIYVSAMFSVSKVLFKESSFMNINGLQGNDSLLVGCIYRSPTSNFQQGTVALCDLLRSTNRYTHLLIGGDFNYPDYFHCSCTNHNLQLFLETLLFQHITSPTRYRPVVLHHIFWILFLPTKKIYLILISSWPWSE